MDRTKNAIVEAFWQLLDEKPFNKITVKNIVELCGVNRNTFYYHFSDIPQLLEHTLKEYTDDVINSTFNPESTVDCVSHLISGLQKHQKAIIHIYNSVQKDIFFKGLSDMTAYTVKKYAETSSIIMSLPEDDRESIIYYYKCLIVGILLDWLDSGMKYDLLKTVLNIYNVLGGAEEAALLKLKEKSKNNL